MRARVPRLNKADLKQRKGRRENVLAVGTLAQGVPQEPAVHELRHSGMPLFRARRRDISTPYCALWKQSRISARKRRRARSRRRGKRDPGAPGGMSCAPGRVFGELVLTRGPIRP